MNLSISNIAWDKEQDDAVYDLMEKYGYTGLEIAPSRVITGNIPYDNLKEAAEWAGELKEKYGFIISSMQSILYGRQENLWNSSEDQETLISYTQKAIDFAGAVNCKHLVFGCPRNRNMPEGANNVKIAVDFFRTIGDYAAKHDVIIGIEANPAIYNTNFLNDTASAISFVREVASNGILLNLDVGTMIENGEELNKDLKDFNALNTPNAPKTPSTLKTILQDNIDLIHHVHISEPNLVIIKNRELHKDIAQFLKKIDYSGFISIEMKKGNSLEAIETVMAYIASIFHHV